MKVIRFMITMSGEKVVGENSRPVNIGIDDL